MLREISFEPREAQSERRARVGRGVECKHKQNQLTTSSWPLAALKSFLAGRSSGLVDDAREPARFIHKLNAPEAWTRSMTRERERRERHPKVCFRELSAPVKSAIKNAKE
jgi:hypothetical protein